MRRLAQHAIVGIGFSALVVTSAVAGLSSPPGEGDAAAAPTPVVSVAGTSATSPEDNEYALALAAQRAADAGRAARTAARARLVATDNAAARADSLDERGKAIAAEQRRIEAAAATRAKKEAAARAKKKAALKRALASRGYEPGVTDPREMARQILSNKYGYGANQFSCFNNIIIRESNWRVNATNPSSGAYGIPQALPGSKMATVAADWRSNPATQIIWGIEYMKSRYGSPCGAWGFKSSHGWY